jgi:hypothetical protein
MAETEEQRIVREARVALAEDMAWDLIGTCSSMIAVAMRRDIVVDDDLEESILLRAFQCDACGWWHGVEELNNLTQRELCDQCHAEANPEKDEDDYTDGPAPVVAPVVGSVPSLTVDPSEAPRTRATSGGGTSFAPVMDVLKGSQPDMVLVVSDEETDAMERLRISSQVERDAPGADVVFRHVGQR